MTSWRNKVCFVWPLQLASGCVWCEVWAHPPPRAADIRSRWPSSWWTVTRQEPNWQVPSFHELSLWFLSQLSRSATTFWPFSPKLCESSGGTIHRGSLSPQDVVPLSYSNPRNTALMNWEPPSGLKTPAWMMSPPTMRFRTWIGGTEGSPR